MSVQRNRSGIKDIPGVGPTTVKKLKEAGIASIMDLAVANAMELGAELNISKERATTFVAAAQMLLRESNFLEAEFTTPNSTHKKRETTSRCTTGSKSLDKLLQGGIETQAVTEFYGESGSGKSQICHTLCVTAQQSIENGGLGSGVLYLDTEGKFRPEIVLRIAKARNLDTEKILNNIQVGRIYDSTCLESIVKDLAKKIKENNARLIIIDSITTRIREELSYRRVVEDRQQKLNIMLHKLVRFAKVFDVAEASNVAIVITNQLQLSPDTFIEDPTIVTGRHTLGHTSTYRIHLRKLDENRVARIIDSPYHPYSDAVFTIGKKGIVDVGH
jgi:DNA repair protein RadA